MTEIETMEAGPAPALKMRALKPSRRLVVERLWAAAKKQIAAHAAHLEDLPKAAAGGEAEAKALATLARTIRELLTLEPDAGGETTDDASDAKAGLASLAALRAELERRLDALAEADSGEAAAPASGELSTRPDAGPGGRLDTMGEARPVAARR